MGILKLENGDFLEILFQSLIKWKCSYVKVSPRKFVYIFYGWLYSKCIQIFWDSLYLLLQQAMLNNLAIN